MSALSSSFDATTKRLLVLLALAVFVSVAILTRSFINVFSSPQEKIAEALHPAPEQAKEVRTSGEEGWNRPRDYRAIGEQTDPFPSVPSDAAIRKKDDAAIKEVVHQQAEHLRTMVRQGKLPNVYGHLTLDQIDEMEKDGVLIE